MRGTSSVGLVHHERRSPDKDAHTGHSVHYFAGERSDLGTIGLTGPVLQGSSGTLGRARNVHNRSDWLPHTAPPAARSGSLGSLTSTTSLLAVHHGGGVGGAPVSLFKLLAGMDHAAFDARAVFTEPGEILTYA